MNYSQFYKEVSTAILENLKKGINTKSYSDKTFTSQIIEKANNKYKVLYCGNTYTVSAAGSYAVGDYIRVCAPCNNWRDLFIVCKTR